jgi:4-amino-4-deoxychorismate lyase
MTDFQLFETMRFEPGTGILRMSLHLKRLQTSAERLGFAGAERAETVLTDYLDSLPTHPDTDTQGPLRLRLELFRDGEITLTTAPFVLQAPGSVWTLRIAEARTTSTDPLTHHKTTRRELYDAARKEFPAAEADEVILLNEKGEIAEGTITNIFVDDGMDRLLTPPLSSGCLAGVLRTSLICAKKAVNQRLRPEDLVGKTLYVGNSLRGLIRAELK